MTKCTIPLQSSCTCPVTRGKSSAFGEFLLMASNAQLWPDSATMVSETCKCAYHRPYGLVSPTMPIIQNSSTSQMVSLDFPGNSPEPPKMQRQRMLWTPHALSPCDPVGHQVHPFYMNDQRAKTAVWSAPAKWSTGGPEQEQEEEEQQQQQEPISFHSSKCSRDAHIYHDVGIMHALAGKSDPTDVWCSWSFVSFSLLVLPRSLYL